MSPYQERKMPIHAPRLPASRENQQTVRMHRDDFEAHLAWIMAKRFHELVLKENFPEKTLYYQIVG
jgi:hypothetical protein